jgi:hypothetical protein
VARGSELAMAFAALLSARGFAAPDGRPLHAYRFTKEEIEGVAALLQVSGRMAVYDGAGRALILAHMAEWFRRERAGGHWDWIRPLKSIGLDYGPGKALQYCDVEDLVRGGLHAWCRPQPTGGERLLAIVRESGFPVAAVRDDPRISAWLRHSVLCAERGFRIEQAVAAEAWRVSERLAQALFEPAVELCAAITDLRAGIPEAARIGDPVEYLDTERPGWRATLPFDVEQEDVRTLVERLVRFRDDHGAALDVERAFVRQPSGAWCPYAKLGLEGEVDLRRVPGVVASAIAEGRRLRIFARPPLARDLIPIAALETREGDEGRIHDVRPFVTGFEVELPLESEARLLAQSGQSTVGEFVPAGGQALTGAVVALDVAEMDETERPTRLRVIGESSCQTGKASLALAIRPEAFGSVAFSAAPTDLGVCDRAGRRLVLFSGTAVFEEHGVRWRWRTAAERNVDARPILVGDLLPGVRETVYRGLPRLWVESDGHVVSPRQGTLYWRPRGRGRWRPLAAGPAFGAIDLAVIEQGEVRHSVGAEVVPAATRFEFDRVRRLLSIPGLDAPTVGATAIRPLSVRTETGVPVVELGAPSGAPVIVVRARWESEVMLTLADPSYELRLIDENDRLVNTRAVFALEGLGGRRILAMREASLCMELRAPGSPRVSISRPVSGEVPLSALRDTVRQLLGRSSSLDARVVLSALGSNECIAEVKWYCEDVNPFATAPRGGPFAALAAMHPLDLRAVSLVTPEIGAHPFTGPATQSDMRAELKHVLPDGPWLVFGQRRSGEIIRPRVVPADRPPAAGVTPLVRAVKTDAAEPRWRAFREAYSDPGAMAAEDVRRLIALLVLARREHLPASSIDPLCALTEAPGVAVRLLAFCDDVDERAAVLDLQKDLPFLWCATPIESWLAAFGTRFDAMRATLAQLGVTFDVTRQATRVLREITGVRPELAGHARAVFLATLAAGGAAGAIDGTTRDFACSVDEAVTRSEIDRLITRHPDGDPPPRDLLSRSSLDMFRRHWMSYNTGFAEVIAAPFAVAEHAAGVHRLAPTELVGCRDAALYDPEYFEALIPMRTNELLNRVLQTAAAS